MRDERMANLWGAQAAGGADRSSARLKPACQDRNAHSRRVVSHRDADGEERLDTTPKVRAGRGCRLRTHPQSSPMTTRSTCVGGRAGASGECNDTERAAPYGAPVRGKRRDLTSSLSGYIAAGALYGGD